MGKVISNGTLGPETEKGWSYSISDKRYNIDKTGKVEEKNGLLPVEYQQVEYLESTGTQYIDTGIKIQENITIHANIASLNNNIYMTALGTNTMLQIQISKGFLSSTYKETNFFTDLGKMYYVEARQTSSERIVIIEEQIAALSSGSNYSNIYLFGLNVGNSLYNSSGSNTMSPAPFIGKIGTLNIYLLNELKRDFIPCYSTTIVTNVNGKECPTGTKGMYDLVEGKFYTNLGNGEDFKAGPDV